GGNTSLYWEAICPTFITAPFISPSVSAICTPTSCISAERASRRFSSSLERCFNEFLAALPAILAVMPASFIKRFPDDFAIHITISWVVFHALILLLSSYHCCLTNVPKAT